MKNTIRTFIAVKIVPDEQLLTFIDNAKSVFTNEKIKWVKASNFHLTLRFLGETSIEQVQKIKSSLNELRGKVKKFKIELSGIDYFKNRETPRVLFVNITDENSSLRNLVQLVDVEVGKAGFETRDKHFNPHLTLARIKYISNKEKFRQFVDEWKVAEFQTLEVNKIIFYHSILNDKGPIYKPIEKCELI